MFNTAPIQIQLPQDTTALRRVATFFGHLDARVFISDTAYLDIGRGSLEAARLTGFNAQEFVGCVGTVGQFCNFAVSSLLFAGGEHRNQQPVNIVFGGVPLLDSIAASQQAAHLRPAVHKPFSIGDGVVLSSDARVLGGVHVGTGAVLAAGAVATSDVAPFSIVGGVPARPIGMRLDEAARARVAAVRWWDFDMVYLMNHLANLQQLAQDTEARHHYRKPMPRLVWRVKPEQQHKDEIDLLGFDQGGGLRPIADAPRRVRDYIAQAVGPGPHHWMPDVWGAS